MMNDDCLLMNDNRVVDSISTRTIRQYHNLILDMPHLSTCEVQTEAGLESGDWGFGKRLIAASQLAV